jgi:hypothetical protein
LCAAILDRRDTVPAPPFSTAVNMWNGTRVVPASSPKIQSPKQMNTPNHRLDEMTCPDIGIFS